MTRRGPNSTQFFDQAIALLEGKSGNRRPDGDALRETPAAGYRHILVDEYQDIDAAQYAPDQRRWPGGSAGRDAKLTILAVGDDDQNIYAFRAHQYDFIRRFEEDYEAQIDYLVENYRSSRHIIEAANALIAATRSA